MTCKFSSLFWIHFFSNYIIFIFNSFKCKRCVNGNQMILPPEKSDCTSDLSQWYHCSKNKAIPDEIISTAWDVTKSISFMFHHRSAQKEAEQKEIKKSKKKIIEDEDEYDKEVLDIDDDSSDEDYK
jgi:DNA repair and recombination protein RAD54 and RAD54-like protein